MSKYTTTCWYCHLHDNSKRSSYSILDKWGCCKRCGTNLKRWSRQGKLIYPSLNDGRLAQEVLGSRESCDIPPNPGTSVPLPIFKGQEGERNPGKVNHCKICWQKTIIFIWSTSRVIDKEKLGRMEQFKNVANLERLAYPICLACIKEHNLKEAKNEIKNI